MDFTGLLYFILELGLFGFITWLIVTYIPMPDVIKKVIIVFVAILMILFCIHNLVPLLPGVPARHQLN